MQKSFELLRASALVLSVRERYEEATEVALATERLVSELLEGHSAVCVRLRWALGDLIVLGSLADCFEGSR